MNRRGIKFDYLQTSLTDVQAAAAAAAAASAQIPVETGIFCCPTLRCFCKAVNKAWVALAPARQVQVYLYGPDQAQLDLSSATAANPGGDNYGGLHPASYAIDQTDAKWYDANKGELTISLAAVTELGYLGLKLGEDRPGRDPVLFQLLASQDNVNWVLLYYNTNPAAIPDVRRQELPHLELAAQWQHLLFVPTRLRGGRLEQF